MQLNIGSHHLTASQLDRLRRAWVHPTPGKVTLRSLQNMDVVVTATDGATGEVIGYICGFTDRTLIGYIWDVEVLPSHHGQGIERTLVERFVAECGDIYQINAHPSIEAASIFEAAGFTSYRARDAVPMTIQNFAKQAG